LKVLHLSDTQLSGAPIRISNLLNKHSDIKSRHIVWNTKHAFRSFARDMVGVSMQKDELRHWLAWADVVHYHNRWKRLEIFKALGEAPPKKPSVIQMHSPRASEDFSEEIASQLPIAVVGQYQPRQWTGILEYIVPNVVDLTDPEYNRELPAEKTWPIVSYAPSNWNCKDWDRKSYPVVSPILKRLVRDKAIYSQVITNQPHDQTMILKRAADIGIDEVSTGSYHLSSLEYLALGIPCFANIDTLTYKVLTDLTGCDKLPWLLANEQTFGSKLVKVIQDKNWRELGAEARAWMERYWAPEALVSHYKSMYDDLK